MIKVKQGGIVVQMIIDYAQKKEYKAILSSTIYKDILTSEDKAEIAKSIYNGMISGEIPISNPSLDTKSIKIYSRKLLSDRLSKSRLLNGNHVYKVQEPGKHIDKRDKVLVELKACLNILKEPAEIEGLHLAIKERKMELTLAKKGIKIDLDRLPKNVADYCKAYSTIQGLM